MTTRAAVLIESSRIEGERDLPGARADVRNWERYLLSRPGGAWDGTEIQVLRKPSKATLRATLDTLARTDYVFVTFSGHGYHPKGGDMDESFICLAENEDVKVNQVNPGNPRCTFVVDSCRGIFTDEALVRRTVVAMELMEKESQDVSVYRELFDAAVQQAEAGIVRLYSCAPSEAAGESSQSGGYFSRFLVECCDDWHRRAQLGGRLYYGADTAFDCASARTTARLPQQHPQYEAGRRLRHFPLGVCP